MEDYVDDDVYEYDEEADCSICGGEGYKGCDDWIQCMSPHHVGSGPDQLCQCAACHGSGLARDQVIW